MSGRMLWWMVGLAACAPEAPGDAPVAPGVEDTGSPVGVEDTADPVPPPDLCDHEQALEVQVGDTLAGEVPPDCELHYYRFVAPADGVYALDKSGGSLLGVCTTNEPGGCICAFESNCCVECTLELAGVGGRPLSAGQSLQIWVDGSGPGPYTFTLSQPGP